MHRLTICLSLLIGTAAALAADKHEHGIVRIDVAIDGATLGIEVEAPLDSLVGFERRPRNDAERKTVEAAVAKMRDGAALFKPLAAAGRKLQKAEAQTDVLGPAPAGKASEHADLEAVYEFRCDKPAELKSLDHGLFEAFSRIRRIEVQVAGPGAQSKQVLKRPQSQLKLVR